MKAQTLFLISAITLSFISCKKNKEETKDDIKSLFSNTTWVGEIKYTVRPVAEPFFVEFNIDGTFVWGELDGEYKGSYELDENTKIVLIKFNSGSSFKGTVADNKTLANLSYSGSYVWAINNFEINRDTLPKLVGTNWKGNSKITPGVTPGIFDIGFKSLTLDYKIISSGGGSVGVMNIPYKHNRAALKFISFSNIFFGVFKNGQISGIESAGSPAIYTNWQVTKQ